MRTIDRRDKKAKAHVCRFQAIGAHTLDDGRRNTPAGLDGRDIAVEGVLVRREVREVIQCIDPVCRKLRVKVRRFLVRRNATDAELRRAAKRKPAHPRFVGVDMAIGAARTVEVTIEKSREGEWRPQVEVPLVFPDHVQFARAGEGPIFVSPGADQYYGEQQYTGQPLEPEPFPERMMPGQTPYTAAERAQRDELTAAAAQVADQYSGEAMDEFEREVARARAENKLPSK